ncbi:MAG: Farnesyl diphosphate synthase [Lentisphaerae bacterium ADurb.BinA184]|nr:MAG: Farnesyl diphosphate synthase [Lentisphaerae bacterium ADurb.BinA184]
MIEPAPPPFTAELAAVSGMIDRLLREEALPERVAPPCLREGVTAYPERGGKRLRPALVLWTCGAVGGNPDHARHAALAVELYHNWTLIHDDIIDGDATRRGRPTCHRLLATHARDAGIGTADGQAAFGRHLAILAGDVLHGWSVEALGRSAADGAPPAVVAALVARLCGHVTPLLISGEALDVEFATRPGVTAAEVEHMLYLKTGVLLEFAAQAGAMIGAGTGDVEAPAVRAAGRFAARAGVAFQLQDDILGMFGDETRLGKPIGADLREGKRTVLLLEGLARADAAGRAELLRCAGNPAVAAPDVTRVQAILDDCGALAATRARAESLSAEARAFLEELPGNRYRALLSEWLDLVCRRES